MPYLYDPGKKLFFTPQYTTSSFNGHKKDPFKHIVEKEENACE